MSEVREEIPKFVAQILTMSPDTIAREAELGAAFSFRQAGVFVDQAKRLVRPLQNFDWAELPAQRLSEIRDALNALVKNLQPIEEFDRINGNANDRSQLISGVGNSLHNMYSVLGPFVAMTALQPSSSFVEEIEQARIARKKVEEWDKESEAALQKIRDRAAQTGVSEEAVHFEAEANTHAASAKGWLMTSFGLAAILLGGAIYSYFRPIPDPHGIDKWEAIQQIGAKLIILSVVSFLLVFVVRNYSTSRHNYILNRHRAVALTTFKQFIAGTGDTETKNHVLLAATKSVFSTQTTGYLRKSEAGSVPVLDLVKFVVGKKE